MATTETKIENLGAVVLSGGKSKRMGFDKWKLPIGKNDADANGSPVTLIEYISDLISKSITPVVICTGGIEPDKMTIDRYPLIPDETNELGPMEGIRVGLKALESECEFAYVSACDIPYFNIEVVKHLFQHLGEAEAIFPVEGQRVFGLNAIYKTALHTRISDLIAENQLRISVLAEIENSKRVPIEELRSFDQTLKFLRNINTPSDYFRLLDELGVECDETVRQQLGL